VERLIRDDVTGKRAVQAVIGQRYPDLDAIIADNPALGRLGEGQELLVWELIQAVAHALVEHRQIMDLYHAAYRSVTALRSLKGKTVRGPLMRVCPDHPH
jgi:hypothetical protein